MKKTILLFVLLLGPELLSAQISKDLSPYFQTKSNIRQYLLGKHTTNSYYSYNQKALFNSPDTMTQTSVLKEMGYILAMETAFSGMSYLASQENGYGPAIIGSFDIFMGLAGLKNALRQESGIRRTGYFLLSAGFIAKSLYNFRFSKNHSKNTRFGTNFIGFNVLVFTGYYLDSLK